jgi:hypothetical protein
VQFGLLDSVSQEKREWESRIFKYSNGKLDSEMKQDSRMISIDSETYHPTVANELAVR